MEAAASPSAKSKRLEATTLSPPCRCVCVCECVCVCVCVCVRGGACGDFAASCSYACAHAREAMLLSVNIEFTLCGRLKRACVSWAANVHQFALYLEVGAVYFPDSCLGRTCTLCVYVCACTWNARQVEQRKGGGQGTYFSMCSKSLKRLSALLSASSL